MLLSSADATSLAVTLRDVTGSTVELDVRRIERAVFVDIEAQNVTVAPGDRAVLNCRVQQLGAKTVRRISTAGLLNFLLCQNSRQIFNDIRTETPG